MRLLVARQLDNPNRTAKPQMILLLDLKKNISIILPVEKLTRIVIKAMTNPLVLRQLSLSLKRYTQ